MVPAFHLGKLMYAEHLVRYRAISALVQGKVVADIASGSGYGSAILGETAQSVVGFDADQDAVQYATEQYGSSNVTFNRADALNIPLDDHSVDVAVTFETIEHIEDYEGFLDELARVVRPGGLVVVSTPNDLEFPEGNHFHLHEFERAELIDQLRRRFDYIDEYFQATWKYVAIDRLDNLSTEMGLPQSTANFAPIQPDQVLYFYFLCSNDPIRQSITPLAAVGEHYSERSRVEEEARVTTERERLIDESRVLRLRAERAENELSATRATRSFQAVQKLSQLSKFRPFSRR